MQIFGMTYESRQFLANMKSHAHAEDWRAFFHAVFCVTFKSRLCRGIKSYLPFDSGQTKSKALVAIFVLALAPRLDFTVGF